MAIKRYWEFDAWKLADAFRQEVFRLLRGSPKAQQDRRFRSQLVESARGPCKHIAEGSLRKSPGTFATFLNYAAGSLGEAEDHLRDGIHQEYFTAKDCEEAFALANRCLKACIKLKHSQLKYRDSQSQQTKSAEPEVTSPLNTPDEG